MQGLGVPCKDVDQLVGIKGLSPPKKHWHPNRQILIENVLHSFSERRSELDGQKMVHGGQMALIFICGAFKVSLVYNYFVLPC